MEPVLWLRWLLPILTWLVRRREHVASFLRRTRDSTLQVVDRVCGLHGSVPTFGRPVSDAGVFVNWVGSRDSHAVYSAARRGEENREGWPQMQTHCGSPFRARFKTENSTEEFCILRFVDGSEAICHIGTNDADAGLREVKIRNVDLDRADAVRKEMEVNALSAAFAATIMESPGAHVNVGTGESHWIEPPERLKSEGGVLKVETSDVWDWRGAWRKNFLRLRRGA